LAVLTGEGLQFVYGWMTSGLRNSYEGWLADALAFVVPWGFALGGIEIPTLLLQGRQDLMVPYAHADWLSKQIPGVEPRPSEEHGHLSLLADIGPVHEWLLAH